MPLDPSGILAFKPTVALEDPLTQTAKALQIRGAQQAQQQSAAAFPGQQAAQAQQLQAGQQEAQQRQIQMDQTAAVNKAYSDAFTIDPATGSGSLDTDKLSSALAQGGHGSAIPAVIEATTKAHQAIATLAETQGKINDQQNDAAGSIGAAVRSAGYDPYLAINLLKNGIQQKAVPAATVQPVIEHFQKLLDQDGTGAAAVPEVKAAMDHMIQQSPKQMATDSAAQTAAARALTAKTGADTAALKAPGEKATSAKDQFDQEFAAKDPLGLKPEERARYNQADAAQKQTIANQAAERKTADANLAVNQARLKVEQDRYGFDAAGGISPQASAIAQGKLDPQTTRAMLRSNPGLLKQVMAADPGFDEGKIDSRFDTLKGLNATTPSSLGGQSLALNTLIHHADLYEQAAAALENGSFTPGNAAYNAVSAMMGSPAPQNAALVAQFLAGEGGKVSTGGVPAEGEIKSILANMATKSSPEQMQGAGDTLIQLAAGRMIPIAERAKEAGVDKIRSVLGPDAKEILTRRGFDPETMKPKTPAGGTSITTPASQAEYNALPKGAQFKKPNDQTVYTKQ